MPRLAMIQTSLGETRKSRNNNSYRIHVLGVVIVWGRTSGVKAQAV